MSDGSSDGTPESAGDSTTTDSDGGCAPSVDITWNHKLPTDGVCTGSGWCWVSPVAPLASVGSAYVAAAAAGGVLWVGGPDPGKLLRYDGTKWTGIVGHVRPIDIATTGPNDVWILEKKNHVWHYDGSVFTEATLPTTFELTAVVAAAPNDAWLIGKSAAVVHWDGTSWKSVDAGIDVSYDVTAAFAAAHNDIWIGASDSKLRHYDGTSWTTRAAPATPTAIWASPGGSKLFVGPSFSSWNGSAWTSVPGKSGFSIVAIGGTSASSLLLVNSTSGTGPVPNYYFNGTTVGYSDSTGSAASDVAAFGGKFVLVASTGSTTVPDNGVMVTPGPAAGSLPGAATPLIPRALPEGYTVLPFGAHDVLFCTLDKGAYRGDPATKTFAPAPEYVPPSSTTCGAVGFSGPKDVWASGGAGIVRHFDGAWHSIVVDPGGGSFVLGDANGATYVQSGTKLSKFDGTAFVSVSTTAPPAKLIAPGLGGEVWTYAPDGSGYATISRFSGGAWSTVKDMGPPEICANLVSFEAGRAYCLSEGGRLLADGTSVAMTTMKESFEPFGGAFDRKRGWVRAPDNSAGLPIPAEMDWFLDSTCGVDHWYPSRSSAFSVGGTTGAIYTVPDGSFLRVEQHELLEWRH